MRLHKWLSKIGVCSLRKAEELIAQGEVFVDGKRATIGQDIDETRADIVVSGKKVSKSQEALEYYMLYKPIGVLCSTRSEDKKPCLSDLEDVKKLSIKWNSVGRLDYFSEGLLLLTNDGPLCNRLMHPRYKVPKLYHVQSKEALPLQAITELKHGIELEDGFVSANLKLLQDRHYEVSIAVGRNRIIRRIFEHYGVHVKRLVRVAVGDLRLDPFLKPGQIRPLTPKELSYLLSLS